MYFDVGIGKDRCARLVKFYAENGVARTENRGGVRRSNVHDAKRQAMIKHISSLAVPAIILVVVHQVANTCPVICQSHGCIGYLRNRRMMK